MKKNARIFVAGHKGLVGSALLDYLRAAGHTELLMRDRRQLDLTRQADVEGFFASEKPEYVFLAAAKVGGIHANNTYPAEFIRDNLAIQTNVIHSAYLHGVKRLLFLGSSCIYPRMAPQPMKESCLLTGPLEPTNRPYALAKIAGIEMCWSYNRQYGTRYLAVMPTNMYGPGDNYHPENSHVIPALIRRFCEAKRGGAQEVTVWGTGIPRREFLHSADMADACVFLMNLPDDAFDAFVRPAVPAADGFQPPLINIGVGNDVTVKELAECIRDVVGFGGRLRFDASRPDGTPRKCLDISILRGLGWKPRIGLREGLVSSVRDFERLSA